MGTNLRCNKLELNQVAISTNAITKNYICHSNSKAEFIDNQTLIFLSQSVADAWKDKFENSQIQWAQTSEVDFSIKILYLWSFAKLEQVKTETTIKYIHLLINISYKA